MDSLVSTDWLADELGAPDLVVLDCTVLLHTGDDGYVIESGRERFEQSHIPGAAFADLTHDLVDATSSLRFAMPSPEHFGAAMERLGVDDHTRVVLYDDNQMMWSARVWFMLRWIGFDNAALLDGGLGMWKGEAHPCDSGPSTAAAKPAGSLSIDPRPEMVADKAEVLAAIEDGSTCIIDALPPAVFEGAVRPYNRPGHILGAVNVASTALIDTDSGRFRPRDQIQAILSERLPDRTDARMVAY